MKSKSIRVGERFGSWVVTGPFTVEKFGTGRGANYPTMYPCRCDCGTEKMVRAFKLLSNSRSCGCQKIEDLATKQTIHGMNRRAGRHPLYHVWDGMTQRCTNPNNDGYKHYGGRGIEMHWDSFQEFSEWAISNGWVHGLQIDRINNDGPYAPSNCRFVTDAQNKRNTRKNVNIFAFGELRCITDWVRDKRCSVSPSTIKRRIASGFLAEEAITQPRSRR